MSETMKILFEGTFNWYGETNIIYAYAKNKRQAWLVMCRRLAKKHGVLPSVTTGYFDGNHDNFKVKER